MFLGGRGKDKSQRQPSTTKEPPNQRLPSAASIIQICGRQNHWSQLLQCGCSHGPLLKCTSLLLDFRLGRMAYFSQQGQGMNLWSKAPLLCIWHHPKKNLPQTESLTCQPGPQSEQQSELPETTSYRWARCRTIHAYRWIALRCPGGLLCSESWLIQCLIHPQTKNAYFWLSVTVESPQSIRMLSM